MISSIFPIALLIATPSAEGNPITPTLCEDIRVELEFAVANAGLDQAIADQVHNNCLNNLG
jgi:hypothetical protein